MAPIVLKEILLFASVKLPQLALFGWGGAWSLGPSNPIAPYIKDLQPKIGHFYVATSWSLFLRAICGDSIHVTSSPPAQVVQISSTSASMSPEPWKLRYIVAGYLAKACIYRTLHACKRLAKQTAFCKGHGTCEQSRKACTTKGK